MAAQKLPKRLRHATGTRISGYTARNRLKDAPLIFEFFKFEFFCVILMKKIGLFSECFVENVHIYRKLNEFHVEQGF